MSIELIELVLVALADVKQARVYIAKETNKTECYSNTIKPYPESLLLLLYIAMHRL